jgi:uncharacterized protein (TIGR03118 family)
LLEGLEERSLLAAGFARINLASDVPGLARALDPNLINPWGLAFSPTGPFWFADNGSGVSDLVDGSGAPIPLVVQVPGGAPTGTVFNAGPGFLVTANGESRPGRFLFAGTDGTISGWSGLLDMTHAVTAVDNSAWGASYTGLALASDRAGNAFLYAADFSLGTVDVFDSAFHPVHRPNAFRDPSLPRDYAPFNVQEINDRLFVIYAERSANGYDDVPGPGHGVIDVFDPQGGLLKRFAAGGALDSPWGIALAPAGFGAFGGDVLVGNNGDGRINAYSWNGTFRGQLQNDEGAPLVIPELWAVSFGNDHLAGDAHTLFFTAGIWNEHDGLFGAIQPPGRHGAATAGQGTFDPQAPGEPGDYPLPPRNGPVLGSSTNVSTAVVELLPITQNSLVLVPTLMGLGGISEPRTSVPAVDLTAGTSEGQPSSQEFHDRGLLVSERAEADSRVVQDGERSDGNTSAQILPAEDNQSTSAQVLRDSTFSQSKPVPVRDRPNPEPASPKSRSFKSLLVVHGLPVLFAYWPSTRVRKREGASNEPFRFVDRL